MGLAGKTACLLFWFVLIFPLYAQPSPGEELPLDDGLLFFEEFFSFDGVFSFDEYLMDGDAFPDGEALNETLAAEPPQSEAPPHEVGAAEQSLTEEQSPEATAERFAAEQSPTDDTFPPDETLLAQPPLDEDFFDDDALFFEAPDMIFEVPTFEARSLEAIFPDFSRRQRILAASGAGLRHSFVKDEAPLFVPNPELEIDLLASVMKKNPSHLIEALVVVPYNGRELDLLDIYNALGRVENIKDHPATVNGSDYYVFTESTRIESSRNRKAVADPLPTGQLPFSETMYLRLKEASFGNLFIRGDVSISMYGITYSMTNFTDVRYFLVPIMRAERFTTIIYLEPIKEGILVYSMTGFYLPGFIADRVNLTPNINRRIDIFTNWITEGLRKQEIAVAE